MNGKLEKMLDSGGWWSDVPSERRVTGLTSGQRTVPATYIVFHTSGSALIQKALESGAKSEAQQAKFVAANYLKSKGTGTHFIVDRSGLVWQMIPVSREVANSAWSDTVRRLYGTRQEPSGEWTRFSQPAGEQNILPTAPDGGYAKWTRSFPGFVSPAQLIPAGAKSPSNGSVFIDLKAPGHKQDFTPDQLRSAASLARGLCSALGSVSSRGTWFKYSDLDPVRRGSHLTKIAGERRVVERYWDPPIDLGLLMEG